MWGDVMYKKHKQVLVILGVSVFTISYFLNLNFSEIASESISIISIMLGIYTLCISNLAGNQQLIRRLTQILMNFHQTTRN